MSSNVFRQAEKELSALVNSIKGTSAVHEAMQQLGGLQRIADEKARAIAALDAEATKHQQLVAETEVACASMRAQAEAQARTILAGATAEADSQKAAVMAQIEVARTELAGLHDKVHKLRAAMAGV